MILSTLPFGNAVAEYLPDSKDARLGLRLRPNCVEASISPEIPFSAVQLHLAGDEFPAGFVAGHTLTESGSLTGLTFRDQVTDTNGSPRSITTRFENAEGVRVEQILVAHDGEEVIQASTRIVNASQEPIALDSLSSFTLTGFPSPEPSRFRVHRFRSVWSAEAKPESRTLEDLHLEPTWSPLARAAERFGQVGSMPVRGWCPFLAVEDTIAKVVWAARLAWAGSWQMEIGHFQGQLYVSGGHADYEFGHWRKRLAPGEALESPAAYLTCVQGSLDDACYRLMAPMARAVASHPEVEADLPIVYNEWCTSWGDPQHDKVMAAAERLRDSGVRYFVIDAGWYKEDGRDWNSGHGDWHPNPKLFPDGLAATAAELRTKGFIPGIWFEAETCGDASEAFLKTDRLLHRDGKPITVRHRRFLNLQNPGALEHLDDRVFGMIDACGFGYLKVDYNETIGVGCDHPDSPGEGLRLQTLGTYDFFNSLRERFPHLVIENCSSGGHRLEPSMMALTAMSSFSDAHETPEIPIIAASLQRLVLPRQSQIWAVLHAEDSIQRLIYSLAATFLGRMCLSGSVENLSDDQWSAVRRAIDLYRKAAPIIRDGRTMNIIQTISPSWRKPSGWQAVVRKLGQDQTLVVAHGFEGAPSSLSIPWADAKAWRILETFSGSSESPTISAEELQIPMRDFSAAVLLLER